MPPWLQNAAKKKPFHKFNPIIFLIAANSRVERNIKMFILSQSMVPVMNSDFSGVQKYRYVGKVPDTSGLKTDRRPVISGYMQYAV